MGGGLKEAGKNLYYLVPRFSPGKKGAQILTHVTLTSVSGIYIRKIKIVVMKSRKTFEERHREV